MDGSGAESSEDSSNLVYQQAFDGRLYRLFFVQADVTLTVGDLLATKRAHVVLPVELLKEIDELVGSRGRSAFIAETVRAELRKRCWLNYLDNEEPIMKDEDHPDSRMV